jgi:chemotaxis protein methyltransferase CheR
MDVSLKRPIPAVEPRPARRASDAPRAPASGLPAIERLEIDLLLEALHRHYGFDFRRYAPSSLRRRVRKRMEGEGVSTVTQLLDRVLHDPACLERLLRDLSVSVTAMFRDPPFFLAFRRHVIPLLRTYPFVRIWHAGCSTGEEVYSMAILLREEGLAARSRIYATDLNAAIVRQAKQGIFPLARMQEYTQNYLRAGGTRAFSDYYTAKYDGALFDPALVQHVLFAQHDLATDASFSEFNVIVCRNVLIYFNRDLKSRVLTLFHDSLAHLGFLVLGRKETIRFTNAEDLYDAVDERERIWRRRS